ncbi:MAG: hypothetical protein P1U88_11925 [Thalassobaculaceae bacterium]|nr:hypothetical protein [Thalassobaculaceae bacterium]
MIPTSPVASDRHVDLSGARRVWAVGALFGEADLLCDLHDAIATRFEPGDRIVYLGNMLGGGDVRATLTELMRFRALVMAQPPLYLPEDIVCLRGAQEEMWHKLLQIHFAPKPKDLLAWMLQRGVGAVLAAYGGDANQGFAAADEGMVALTRWTARLKSAVLGTPGHQMWFNQIRRFAHTGKGGVLFVNTGVEPSRALHDQRDAFWWGSQGFERVGTEGIEGFTKVVRGYDPAGRGVTETDRTLCIDSGCGRGGALSAACLSPDGRLIDWVEVAPSDSVVPIRAAR